MTENSCSADQDPIKNSKTNVNCSGVKKPVPLVSKDMKSKYGVSYVNMSNKFVKQHPLLKKKFTSTSNNLTNASARVVLFERNVEIKDLESKVKYFHNKIKELESENRTLHGIQSRQERELKKFKEGVADIPSLLRAHKEEIKVYESTINGIRKELRDCQKEVKLRNESLLKKESLIDKLNVMVKQNGKILQNFCCENKELKMEKRMIEEENKQLVGINQNLRYEIKELKTEKRNIEDENKQLVGANQNLKCENDALHMKIKDMHGQIENLEGNLNKKKDSSNQHKVELEKLQKCVEKLQQKGEDRKHKASGNQYNSTSEEHSNINSSEIVPRMCSEDESKNVDNSLVTESNVEVRENKQSDGKANDALIPTSKCYQDFFGTNFTRCSSVLSDGSQSSSLKLLPPLKQHSRKYLQDPAIFSKEFYSSTDICLKSEKLPLRCDKLSKQFQDTLKMGDYQTEKLENKIFAFRETIKKNKCDSFNEFSKQDDVEF